MGGPSKTRASVNRTDAGRSSVPSASTSILIHKEWRRWGGGGGGVRYAGQPKRRWRTTSASSAVTVPRGSRGLRVDMPPWLRAWGAARRAATADGAAQDGGHSRDHAPAYHAPLHGLGFPATDEHSRAGPRARRAVPLKAVGVPRPGLGLRCLPRGPEGTGSAGRNWRSSSSPG